MNWSPSMTSLKSLVCSGIQGLIVVRQTWQQSAFWGSGKVRQEAQAYTCISSFRSRSSTYPLRCLTWSFYSSFSTILYPTMYTEITSCTVGSLDSSRDFWRKRNYGYNWLDHTIGRIRWTTGIHRKCDKLWLPKRHRCLLNGMYEAFAVYIRNQWLSSRLSSYHKWYFTLQGY